MEPSPSLALLFVWSAAGRTVTRVHAITQTLGKVLLRTPFPPSPPAPARPPTALVCARLSSKPSPHVTVPCFILPCLHGQGNDAVLPSPFLLRLRRRNTPAGLVFNLHFTPHTPTKMSVPNNTTALTATAKIGRMRTVSFYLFESFSLSFVLSVAKMQKQNTIQK